MDFATGLAAAAQALAITKELRNIDGGFDIAETKAKMSEIYSNLADVKIALADAQLEIRAKDETINELLEAQKYNGELVDYRGFKYIPNDDGTPSGNAFCPVCITNEGKFFHIQTVEGSNRCPNCQKVYGRVNGFAYKE